MANKRPQSISANRYDAHSRTTDATYDASLGYSSHANFSVSQNLEESGKPWLITRQTDARDYYSACNSTTNRIPATFSLYSSTAKAHSFGATAYPAQPYRDYYDQSNYAAHLTFQTMDYSQWGNSQYPNQQYNYQYPPAPGYDQYAQQQQYQPTPPQIRNPFAPPPPPQSQFTAQNANFDPDYEAQIAQWQSAYAPQDQFERGKKGGRNDKGENPNLTTIGVRQGPVQNTAESGDARAKTSAPDDRKRTVVRKGGGESWEDDSLLEWDPTHFRIMVGNLAGEVTDDSLAKAFTLYGVSKARVVRDKRTTKSKGFGFVSFPDAEKGFKAAREMLGKYIGSHPVTIERAKTDVRPVFQKDKHKGKNHKNRDKGGKKQEDTLRANTGAHIEKKPVKNSAGMKMLG